jgi:hypothetical protein
MMPENDAYYLLPPARQRMVDLVKKIDTVSNEIFIADCNDSLKHLSTFLPKEMTHIIYEYLDRNNPFTDTLWLHFVP